MTGRRGKRPKQVKQVRKARGVGEEALATPTNPTSLPLGQPSAEEASVTKMAATPARIPLSQLGRRAAGRGDARRSRARQPVKGERGAPASMTRPRRFSGQAGETRHPERGQASTTPLSRGPEMDLSFSGSEDEAMVSSPQSSFHYVGAVAEKGGGEGETQSALSSLQGASRWRNRREVDPPKYDGKAAFSDFLEDFRLVAEYNDWQEAEKCFRLWHSIAGGARVRLRSIQFDATWARLVPQLEKLFASERAIDAFRSKWLDAKRSPEMDLEAYGHFLLDLARKANPLAVPSEQDRFARDKFLETTGPSHMKFWLRALKPKTLQDAVDLASQYDAACTAFKPQKSAMAHEHMVAAAGPPEGRTLETAAGPPGGRTLGETVALAELGSQGAAEEELRTSVDGLRATMERLKKQLRRRSPAPIGGPATS